MPHRKCLTGALAAGAALAVCLILSGAASAASPPDCLPMGGVDAVIAGVAPGPTLVTADRAEIVLAGIAFPQGPDLAGEVVAAAALGAAREAPVRIVPVGPPDRYGRLPAHVLATGGGWLQADLIGAGLAIVRLDGAADGCADRLLAAETAARAARAGLWAGSNNAGKVADNPSLLAADGLYGLVEGRVVSVGYGSRMAFVDFGHDIRTDFTVMVPNSLVPRLREAGIALEKLRGRDVRVRGVIEESGGPAIRLDDPRALELLDR